MQKSCVKSAVKIEICLCSRLVASVNIDILSPFPYTLAQLEHMDKDREPHIWTGNRDIAVTISETDELTSRHLTQGQEMLIVDLRTLREYSVKLRAVEQEETPEKEKPVKLRGRFGIAFRIKDSPT